MQEAQSRIAPNSSAPGSRIPTPVKPVKQSAKDKKHESTQELGPSNHTRPTKRQRREVESDNISLPNNDKNAASDDEEEPLSIGTPRSPLSKALEEKPSAIDGEKSTLPKREEKKDANSAGAEDESDLSSPLDDEPRTKAKARNRRSGSVEKKVNTKAKSKAKDTKRKASDTNPDGDEIKRLQGWLIKCGIRKMWYKELAPYDSPKAKIRHLKDMLNDAGMTGRYSVERATQIRDARELKSELEAVQAGAKQWGKANSDDETEVKPKKRLARGLTELDFLNESDGAETD